MNNKSDTKAERSEGKKEWLRQYRHSLYDFLRNNLRDDFTADKIDEVLSGIEILPSRYTTVNLSFNVELLPEERQVIVDALGRIPHVGEWSISSSGRITVAFGSGYTSKPGIVPPRQIHTPPQFGERLLLLILSKEERANIPGDLAEEYVEIAVKHTEGYARFWYYKQVVASAWPLIRKTLRWGAVMWIGEWIRKYI
ncbi:MAG: hypothetical protein M3362_00800 [Acidobacteriota bacterium]|nr:hypothetical protein [Acidobacteriota bacterium]